jgi:CRP/FNR family transcriptional regulator, dissimilatory nitrate respiration regulator
MPVPAAVATALRAHHLFESLGEELFARALLRAEIVALDAGQLLFQRGERASWFFVVLEGEIKLALHSRTGEEKIVERLLPGQSFAEALMFIEVPVYPLAAIAVQHSRLVRIEAAGYLAMLRDSPDACLRLLADLSRRLHARIREIEELTLESATRRVARHLLELAPLDAPAPVEVVLDESRQMLASRLAMKPETLSRILRSLSDLGAIRVEGRSITLLDRQALQAA